MDGYSLSSWYSLELFMLELSLFITDTKLMNKERLKRP